MKNTKKIISKILIYFALILGVLFCLVPLYWMIRSSLMNTVEVFMMPPRWIPSKFMWENYQEVFDTLPFGKYFLNSFIVTGGCVVGTMLTSSICAYGLARIKWRGRNVVFACIILPDDAECELPFRFDETVEEVELFIFRVAFDDRVQGAEDFFDGLDEFRFVCVFRAYIFNDRFQILIHM